MHLALLILADCNFTLPALRYTFDAETIHEPSGLLPALMAKTWDLLVIQYPQPGYEVLDVLRQIRSQGWELACLVISDLPGERAAVAAMQAGADDYILSSQVDQLPTAIQRSLTQRPTPYRAVVDSFVDVVYLKDLEGRYRLINPACSQYLGLSAQDILNKNDQDLFGPIVAQRLRAQDLEVMDTGETRQYESTISIQGLTYTFSVTKVPYRSAQGAIQGIVGISRDISERKGIESALRETNELLRAVIRSSPVALTVVAPDGTILLWNEQAERLFGWTANEVLGQILPMIPRADRIHYLGLLKQDQPLPGQEIQGITKEGLRLDLKLSTTPVYDASQHAVGILCILENITDSKRIEIDLLHIEEKYRRLRELSEGWVAGQKQVLELIATGTDLTSILEIMITLIEDLAPGLTGSVLLLEPTGQSIMQGVAPKLPPGYVEALIGLAIGPQSGSCGTAMYRKQPVIVTDTGQDPLWQDFRVLAQTYDLQACWSHPVYSSQAQVLGCFAFYAHEHCAPSTEQWSLIELAAGLAGIAIEYFQREARLKLLTMTVENAGLRMQELEDLNRLKDDFLSTVSHELRTPMANMKLALHMLGKLIEDPRQRGFLTIIEGECTRETNLINDLLDIQKLESGTKVIYPEAIILSDWLAPILTAFTARLQHRNLTLNLAIAPALPDLHTDALGLERILVELLTNACKYSPPQTQIQVRVYALDTWIALEVENQGPGIPSSALPKIFNKFYRVPNSDPWQQGGTGLGLALAQKLVNQLGGQILVTSQPGATIFSVLLPVANDGTP